MNARYLWLGLVLGALLIGCGGGGGSSSTPTTDGTTDGGTTAGATNLQISGNRSGISYDLGNVQVGDQVTLKVFGRDSLARTVEVSAKNWTTNAPSTVARVTSAGELTAVGPTSGESFSVSATANGTTVANTLTITSNAATLTGRIKNVNNTGIGGIKIRFYTATGSEVGQATTGLNGTFLAALPTSAKRFTIDIEAADPKINSTTIYYRQFSLDSVDYLNGEATCYAPLPNLTVGSTVSLPTEIFIPARSGGPPPPPTGCVG